MDRALARLAQLHCQVALVATALHPRTACLIYFTSWRSEARHRTEHVRKTVEELALHRIAHEEDRPSGPPGAEGARQRAQIGQHAPVLPQVCAAVALRLPSEEQ